ncbi:hypothetical protein HanRHA438_Chr04g0179811 [Helianthus annuus]|nr:hypothetical protein HanRHA438_Chr04g0179811 [Helianthus annuus]
MAIALVWSPPHRPPQRHDQKKRKGVKKIAAREGGDLFSIFHFGPCILQFGPCIKTLWSLHFTLWSLHFTLWL